MSLTSATPPKHRSSDHMSSPSFSNMESSPMESHSNYHHDSNSIPVASNDSVALTKRLVSARRTVQEYIDTALRTASSDVIFTGIHLDDFYSSETSPIIKEEDTTNTTMTTSKTNRNAMWLRPPSTTKELFEMGISIFEANDFNGGLEDMIHVRLGQVESDLCQIANMTDDDSIINNVHNQNDSMISNEENNTNNMKNIFMDIDNMKINDDQQILDVNDNIISQQEEARSLLFKIRFLRTCADVRNTLEESAQSLSKNIVQSAKLLLAAETLQNQSEQMIQLNNNMQQRTNEQNTNNEDSHASTMNFDPQTKTQDAQMAHHILSSIHNRILQQRSGLYSHASSILDTCLTITDSNIVVRNPTYDIVDDDNDDGDVVETTSSLNAAFHVYAALSKKDKNALEDALFTLSTQLLKVVFHNLMQENANSNDTSNDQNKIQKDTLTQTHSYPIWKFQQHKVEDNNDSEPHGTSIPVTSLHWNQSKIDQSSQSTTSITNASIRMYVEPWEHILNSITTVLDFIFVNVLMKRKDLSSIVGDCLFTSKFSKSSHFSPNSMFSESLFSTSPSSETNLDGPLFKKLLDIGWESCIPSSHSNVKEVGMLLLQISQKFEQSLCSNGYIEKSSGCSSNEENVEYDNIHEYTLLPLSKFASNLEHNYAEKRRSQILNKGRTILLKDDFHNTITVGTDPDEKAQDVPCIPTIEYVMDDNGQSVFLLHKSAISQVALSIMNLSRETLDEAIDPNSLISAGPHLYRASRELFDLYRAIIKTIHGSAISSIPRTAAIYHNDCIYFAHQMLTLGHEYRERFPPESHDVLQKMCTFVDFVPIFREMGNRVLVDMIEKQNSQLTYLVFERVQGLRNAIRMNEEVTEWSEAETGVRAADYHLRHLSMAWTNILSRDVYGRSLGSLVDTLLNILLDQVMNATDISETASHFVGVLFADTMKASELFSGGEYEAKKYCHLWEKFNAVRKFMDMSLAKISEALSEGFFRSVTGPELSNLIRAAFADSEKRKVILLALASE